MISEILFFLLGCLFGWFTNHWYSVNMKRPNLVKNGEGHGSSFFGSGYSFVTVNIQNELRRFGVTLPKTVILGKSVKTDFGGLIIERDTARQCRATLLEKTGEQIQELFWFDGEKAYEIIDIKSGETAHLVIFVRKENVNQYLVYHPVSGTDFTPRTVNIPKFDKSMSFLIEVSYSYDSQKVRIPVRIKIEYDGSFNLLTNNGEVGF